MGDLPEIKKNRTQGGHVSHRPSRPATPFGVAGAPEVSYPAGVKNPGRSSVTVTSDGTEKEVCIKSIELGP